MTTRREGKLREFFMQWFPKNVEDLGHIEYPPVCSREFKSVTEGEMIPLREVSHDYDDAVRGLVDVIEGLADSHRAQMTAKGVGHCPCEWHKKAAAVLAKWKKVNGE